MRQRRHTYYDHSSHCKLAAWLAARPARGRPPGAALHRGPHPSGAEALTSSWPRLAVPPVEALGLRGTYNMRVAYTYMSYMIYVIICPTERAPAEGVRNNFNDSIYLCVMLLGSGMLHQLIMRLSWAPSEMSPRRD